MLDAIWQIGGCTYFSPGWHFLCRRRTSSSAAPPQSNSRSEPHPSPKHKRVSWNLWTNIFWYLDKYIWPFEQIHFAIWTNPTLGTSPKSTMAEKGLVGIFGQICFAIWTNVYSHLDKSALGTSSKSYTLWQTGFSRNLRTNMFWYLDKYTFPFGQICTQNLILVPHTMAERVSQNSTRPTQVKV